MHKHALRTFLSLTLLCRLSASVLAQEVALGGGWIDTPEAYFATGEETTEWLMLKSDAEKQAFIERYWLRRDPTPGTPRNEFKEVVLGRIKVADEKFSIDTTRGSSTARGMVFILFGTPAAVTEKNSGVPNRSGSGGEWSQVQTTWKWDRFRTKSLLELIGRPQLEITFIITPSEKRDQIQDPGVIAHYRKLISDASVVNRDVAAPAASAPQPKVELVAATDAALPDAATKLLTAATSAPSTLRTSSFFMQDGKPATMFWLTVPGGRTPTGPATLYGRVTDAQQQVVTTVSREMRASEGFTTRTGDVVYAIVVPLAPGTYDAAFALQSGLTGIASGVQRVTVPPTGSGFDVSSLVLTHDLTSSDVAALELGGARVRPRADNVFATSESVWYAFQVASPTDPGTVKTNLVLRRTSDGKTQTLAQSSPLVQTAPASYVGGFEIPLQTVEPGDYSLYLTISDGSGRQQVRRADFKVVAAQ